MEKKLGPFIPSINLFSMAVLMKYDILMMDGYVPSRFQHLHSKYYTLLYEMSTIRIPLLDE